MIFIGLPDGLMVQLHYSLTFCHSYSYLKVVDKGAYSLSVFIIFKYLVDLTSDPKHSHLQNEGTS